MVDRRGMRTGICIVGGALLCVVAETFAVGFFLTNAPVVNVVATLVAIVGGGYHGYRNAKNAAAKKAAAPTPA